MFVAAAAQLDHMHVLLTAAALLNVRYMAPEVYKCEGYTEAVDVYAWAHLVAEMLTLERPYDSYSAEVCVFVRDAVWPGKRYVRETLIAVPMLYVYYYCCCNNSTDDFYEKVVCGGERPRLGPAPPAPLRALLRRCWSLQSDSRPSMPVILGHLAFITAEAEREKGGVAAGGAYYGEISAGKEDEAARVTARSRSDTGAVRTELVQCKLFNMRTALFLLTCHTTAAAAAMQALAWRGLTLLAHL
eukprot:18011-Heterococcus_DN1.PRE.3